MNSRRQLLLNAFHLFDLGLMICAFVFSAILSVTNHSVTVQEFFSMRIKIKNFVIFALLVLCWHLIFRLCRLYNSRRMSERRGEVLDIIKATSLGTLIILSGSIVFHISLVTTRFLVTFWIISTCATVISRLFLRIALAQVRKRGRNLRNVIIVGTNSRALAFADKLVGHPELGYRIAGFADQDWNGLAYFRKSGNSLMSDLEQFPQFLRSFAVDEVAIALPFRSMHDQASRIAVSCEEQGISVRVLTSVFDLKKARSTADEFEGDPLMIHSAGWVEGWPLLIKRMMDLTIALIAIMLLSPVLLVAAILIKLTSTGPILFAQERLGLNKRHFTVYKFRTMVIDAEKRMREIEHLNEVTGPVFKIKNDPRITQVGKMLRKTSIDELPQLINVLIGDMSLVGPRPLPVRDYEGFDKDWQRRRFSVRPGITCLWQVHGRSSIPFEKWMELDLQYIDKWSLWLDFQILLRTIPAVLRGSGAA